MKTYRFLPEALLEYEEMVEFYERALVVLAIFHNRRRPGYWHERLARLR